MIKQAQLAILLLIISSAVVIAAEPVLPFGMRAYPAKPAPQFQLETIDGEKVDLQTMQGKWVFVHFWASWCGPCRKEMPAIEKLSQLISENELSIVMVNVAEDEDTIFSFLGEVTPTLDSYMDKDGQAIEAWQPRGLPATYLVDPSGTIRYQALGGREWNQPEYLDFIKRVIE
jgi:thiol-disulfide isomerase/thioredoxin